MLLKELERLTEDKGQNAIKYFAEKTAQIEVSYNERVIIIAVTMYPGV